MLVVCFGCRGSGCFGVVFRSVCVGVPNALCLFSSVFIILYVVCFFGSGGVILWATSPDLFFGVCVCVLFGGSGVVLRFIVFVCSFGSCESVLLKAHIYFICTLEAF